MSSHEIDGLVRVRMLSEYANLPLSQDREQAVADILDAWLPDANALSQKMSATQYQALSPVTVFVHPVGSEEEG